MTNEIAATTAAETAQQFHQSTLQLDLNRLESALIEEQSENGNSVGKNRLVKRRALESIASATTGTANISPGKKAQQWSVLSRADKQAIAKIILPVLLQCWKDPTEKCRELSITLIGR
jgi:hypothetical protein